MRVWRGVAAACWIFGLIGAAGAHDFEAGAIGIDRAVIEASQAGPQVNLASLAITNGGKVDALVAVSCADARAVEIRRTFATDAGTAIRPVPWLPIAAGGTLDLGREGYYLAFVGLKRALSAGDRVAATLRFSSGVEVPVQFSVGESATEGQAAER